MICIHKQVTELFRVKEGGKEQTEAYGVQCDNCRESLPFNQPFSSGGPSPDSATLQILIWQVMAAQLCVKEQEKEIAALLNRLTIANLHIEELKEDLKQTDDKLSKEYVNGLKTGVRRFAWWKDGKQEVGTTGTLLKKVLEDIDNGEGDRW